ncbi:unnamed protein product [Moneuplotes crassus]|uniref:Uncharacterized protein n=1 Tax=Euplotes crassus TaxID=5936 RepID=A0AAD1XSI4_EUPCR|nr:unnamed protein product [Moneuplotes crassus]
MGSFLQKLIVLALVVSIVTCKEGLLSGFRENPEKNLTHRVDNLDANIKNLLLFISLMRTIEFIPFDFIEIDSKATELLKGFLKRTFNCTSLACVTPDIILFRIMREFRWFSRGMVTEMEYGFETLKNLYAKKHSGVVIKIINDKGKGAFDDKSQCIRMRIGQFFMPTFKGNDTSNCSEFDEIIHSFSEQSEDFWRDFGPLIFKLLTLVALILLIRKSFKLAKQEWSMYKTLTNPSLNHQSLNNNPHQPFNPNLNFTDELLALAHQNSPSST